MIKLLFIAFLLGIACSRGFNDKGALHELDTARLATALDEVDARIIAELKVRNQVRASEMYAKYSLLQYHPNMNFAPYVRQWAIDYILREAEQRQRAEERL